MGQIKARSNGNNFIGQFCFTLSNIIDAKKRIKEGALLFLTLISLTKRIITSMPVLKAFINIDEALSESTCKHED